MNKLRPAITSFIFLNLLCLPCLLKAQQAPSIEWQKSIGGSNGHEAKCVIQTSDGGYAIAGRTSSIDGDVSDNHGGNDAWVIKMDASGNIEWQKCFGGSSDEFANSIIQTSDGGYAITGFTYSNNGDVSGNHGNRDVWVVKLSSSGTIEWQKCLGGTESDEAFCIVQTSDEGRGYIIAATTESKDGDVLGNHGKEDFWIVKISASGSIEWQKCYGGSDYDEVHSIIQTSEGGYVVAGSTDSQDGDVFGKHAGGDAWVIKLNSQGIIQWQKCFGGSNGETAYSLIQTFDGGYA